MIEFTETLILGKFPIYLESNVCRDCGEVLKIMTDKLWINRHAKPNNSNMFLRRTNRR